MCYIAQSTAKRFAVPGACAVDYVCTQRSHELAFRHSSVLHTNPGDWAKRTGNSSCAHPNAPDGCQEAVLFTVIFGLASLVFLVIGALIFWRLWGTSHELLGLLTSFIFITIGLTGITGVFEGGTVSPNPFLQLAFTISGISFFVLFPCLAAFLLTFPNGRFNPRWSWLLILLWLGQFAFFMVSTTGIFADATYSLLVGVVIVTWGSTLSIQVYRYMRVYTYSERQRTKWLVFGLASGLLLTAASTILRHLLPQLSRPDSPYQLLMNNLGGLLIFLPLSWSIGIALLRYRLYDIDRNHQSHPGLWDAHAHPDRGLRWFGHRPASALAGCYQRGQQRGHRHLHPGHRDPLPAVTPSPPEEH